MDEEYARILELTKDWTAEIFWQWQQSGLTREEFNLKHPTLSSGC